MSTTEQRLMTAEEFLALPDDGKDRELIRGRLKEEPMTYRNRLHAWVEAQISFLLKGWLHKHPDPPGDVYSGEAGCLLKRDPDTIVGINVAYFSRDVVAQQTEASTLMVGPPLLAVEILSPSDKQEDIHEKVREYLQTGVRQVWIVDPYFRTVQVHRPGQPPESFNERQSLAGSELLPGLELPVAEMFPAPEEPAKE